MLKRCAALLLVASSVAVASRTAPIYQDAVLKNFRTKRIEIHCSSGIGNGSTGVRGEGNASGSGRSTSGGSTSCGYRVSTFYTVVMGEHVYVLTPALLGQYAPTGLARLLVRSPSLEGAFPGTAIKMRSDDGNIYVKLGKRESEYKIVSAK